MPTLGEALATLNSWSDRPPPMQGVLRLWVTDDPPRRRGVRARLRFWAELPDRDRVEVLQGLPASLHVRSRGEGWEVTEWGTFHRARGARPDTWLWNLLSAASSLSAGRPTLLGTTEVLGRAAALLRVDDFFRDDVVEFAVDIDTGMVLRRIHREGDVEVNRMEVEELALGGPLPAEVFAFRPDPGTAVQERQDDWPGPPPPDGAPPPLVDA